jgi:mono/diheme cytochrome c family protein
MNLRAEIIMAAQLVAVLLLLQLSVEKASGQDQPPPQSPQQFQGLIRSVEGPELFRAYCASCHGVDAKGDGPAAAAMKINVPDLTVLAKNNRGQFPSAHVRNAITGDIAMPSHGSRQMPVWGPIFHQVEQDIDRGNVRVDNLVKYLESIQGATLSTRPVGAELYKQHCLSCHGTDLKGGGPPPPAPYRIPPDLTTLARRHGGTFPGAYVQNVLRRGAVIPAHGPIEMPIWGADFKPTEITDLTNYLRSQQQK